MKRALLVGLGLLLFVAACGGSEEEAQQPLKIPEKEKTWVKTEKVEITKQEALAHQQAELDVSVDEALRVKLTQVPLSKQAGLVTDKDTCLSFLKPLDDKRKQVQREGGMWHAFERSDAVRPYSDNGVQLDSNMNKLFHALGHLCRTANGVPQTGLAMTVNRDIDKMGVEGTRNQMVELGNPIKVVDEWIEYALAAKKNSKRKVPYPTIEELIRKTQPLIDLYAELLSRKLDDSNQQQFLSDAVTLLAVVNGLMSEDTHLTMARAEDLQVPYEQYRNEM